MLKIQEELLKDAAFYREAFEEGKAEGETRGVLKGKLATVPLLRRLELSDAEIAKELGLALAAVQSVPKANP